MTLVMGMDTTVIIVQPDIIVIIGIDMHVSLATTVWKVLVMRRFVLQEHIQETTLLAVVPVLLVTTALVPVRQLRLHVKLAITVLLLLALQQPILLVTTVMPMQAQRRYALLAHTPVTIHHLTVALVLLATTVAQAVQFILHVTLATTALKAQAARLRVRRELTATQLYLCRVQIVVRTLFLIPQPQHTVKIVLLVKPPR